MLPTPCSRKYSSCESLGTWWSRRLEVLGLYEWLCGELGLGVACCTRNGRPTDADGRHDLRAACCRETLDSNMELAWQTVVGNSWLCISIIRPRSRNNFGLNPNDSSSGLGAMNLQPVKRNFLTTSLTYAPTQQLRDSVSCHLTQLQHKLRQCLATELESPLSPLSPHHEWKDADAQSRSGGRVRSIHGVSRPGLRYLQTCIQPRRGRLSLDQLLFPSLSSCCTY